MRISIIGHFDETIEEGVRNVTREIARHLERQGNHIQKLDIKNPSNFFHLVQFKPDVIHFMLSPTSFGLLYAALANLSLPKSKIVISILNPSSRFDRLLRIVEPDLIIFQSTYTKLKIDTMGYQSRFLPNGVDTEKFRELDRETRIALRKKYGLNEDSFIVLHLASFKKERNLDIFKRIQKDGFQVIIIGRIIDKPNVELINELESSGCIVWIEKFENIEEIYNLSDCYVFPTVDREAAIEIPLSVLEAMACNIRVITTPFGGLPLMFEEGEGLNWARNDDEILELLIESRKRKDIIETRKRAIEYSWDEIICELREIYHGLLD